MQHTVTRHNYDNSGLILHTGARPRPYDPREEKYRLTRTIDVSRIDLSQAYSLVRDDGWDPRPAITDQGQKGACASVTACEIAEELSWNSGAGQPPVLSGSDLYERVRKLENGSNWQQDTGSTLADNLDLAMQGLYSEADAPESDDLARDYDRETQGKQTFDFVLGHQPFYPGETSDPDFFVKCIAWAISQNLSVDLGAAWPNPWFTPDEHGILPPATRAQYAAAGGHSFRAYAVLPILGGVVACPNHWTPAWNRQVAAVGYHLRPGDFLIPFSFFRQGVNPYLEGRVVTWQPVTPAPQPDPQPQPAATCRQAALGIVDPLLASAQAIVKRSPHNASAHGRRDGLQAARDALSQMPE